MFSGGFVIVSIMKSIRSKLKNTKPISSRSKLITQAEKRHIQAHLALTELRLRFVRPKNTVNRQLVLDILQDYWKAGMFPINTHKTARRTPVFIDDKGTYCAVGHLLAQTGYVGLASEINQDNKFVLVEKLNNRKAEAWLNKYGLSREEAALIQPGYGGFIIERVGYSAQDKILAIITLIASLLLLAFVVVALHLIKSTSTAKPTKRKHLFRLAVGAAVITAGIIFYLPTPKQAVNSLTSGASGKDTITCGGFGAGKLTGICKEFQDKGSVPGWREVPCEEICLL